MRMKKDELALEKAILSGDTDLSKSTFNNSFQDGFYSGTGANVSETLKWLKWYCQGLHLLARVQTAIDFSSFFT